MTKTDTHETDADRHATDDGWVVGLRVRHRLGEFQVTYVDRHDPDVQLSVQSTTNPDSGFKDYAFMFDALPDAKGTDR